MATALAAQADWDAKRKAAEAARNAAEQADREAARDREVDERFQRAEVTPLVSPFATKPAPVEAVGHPTGTQLGAQSDTQLGAQAPNVHPTGTQSDALEGTPLGAQSGAEDRPASKTWAARHGERFMPSRAKRGRLNVRLPSDLLDELAAYCVEHGADKQDVVEQALKKVLGTQRGRHAGAHSVGHPTMIDHDHDEMIMIYAELTGKRPTARDRQTAAELRAEGFTTEDVRAGVRLAIERKPDGFGTLAYCANPIREAAAARSRAGAGPVQVLDEPKPPAQVLAELAATYRGSHSGATDEAVRAELARFIRVNEWQVDEAAIAAAVETAP